MRTIARQVVTLGPIALVTVGGACLALTAASGTASAPAAPRPATFAICAGCHSTEPGKTIVGPSLAGVGGRKAGSLAGYAYSDALKASGLTWNEATLEKWLTSPQKTVPGTKMPFTGIADPVERRKVVAYLLTLR